MKNRIPIDLISILAVFGAYAAAIYLLVPVEWLGGNNGDDRFLPAFQQYAVIATVVSLVCMLAYYALGQWGFNPLTGATTWLLTWSLLLILSLVTATVLSVLGPHPRGSDSTTVNYAEAGIYYAATLLYYLASVFFSPPNGPYHIWPAKLVRR